MGAAARRPYNKKAAPEIFLSGAATNNCARVIAALAVAFLSLVASCRVVAAPGSARQQVALHLSVAARQVDHRRLVLFLSRRALRPEAPP